VEDGDVEHQQSRNRRLVSDKLRGLDGHYLPSFS
jgi:hypothetical protein